MVSFDYVRPQTLDQLLTGLHQSQSDGAILAGGTDLHVKIRAGLSSPRVLFDISELAPCRSIIAEEASLRIGGAVRMAELMASAAVWDKVPSLAAAAREMSSRQIRNRATLAGNIVTASPAADAVPPLLAADATLVLVSSAGKRILPLAEFLLGPGKNSLAKGEVMAEILIPSEPSGCCSGFVKVGRRKAQAISIINLAGSIHLGQDGIVKDVRIALGAVGPTAMRARQAEAALLGRNPTTRNLEEAAELAARECHPISDVRGTGSGRRLLVKAWTLRLLQQLSDKSRAMAEGQNS